MLTHLIQHLKGYIPVSDSLRESIQKICKEINVPKGTFLHQPGKICTHTYFIHSGLLRIYYQKDDKEITDNFAAEGEWITSVYSFMRNIPDNFYIETLEPCELIAIGIEDLENCFAAYHEMERFGRYLMSSYFLEHSERSLSFKFHSAKEKYQYFCKSSKNKVSRIPLGILASYLGITQETLSRIRAEKDPF